MSDVFTILVVFLIGNVGGYFLGRMTKGTDWNRIERANSEGMQMMVRLYSKRDAWMAEQENLRVGLENWP